MALPVTPETARLFFDRLLQSLPDQVYFKDRDGRFLCVNQSQARFLGIASPEEALGRNDYDFFEPDQAREKDADEREVVRSGQGFVDKEELSTSIGGKDRWCLTSKLPLIGDDGEIIGTFGISHDITEMKEAREALNAHNRLLSTLIEILPCRIFVKDREGRLRLTNQAYRRSVRVNHEMEIVGRRLDHFGDTARMRRFAKDDKAVIEKGVSILNSEDFDPTNVREKWLLVSRVPLRDGEGNVEGVVGMAADITDQKNAEARALDAQRELEKKNLQIESELDLAGELQTELMASSMQSVREELDGNAPFLPKIGFTYMPSEHLAGDFFQLLPISPHSFGLLMCDVMGHGVKAALVTTLIRGLLADLRADELRPAEVLARLNARLCPLLDRPPLPRFVTALYAVVDTQNGTICQASAGHPWPLCQSGGEVKPVSEAECGPALGLMRDSRFVEAEHQLAHGDRLLLYTDGWSEECNAQGDEFGRDRMAASMRQCSSNDPEKILSYMAQVLADFAGDTSHHDDLCAVLACF